MAERIPSNMDGDVEERFVGREMAVCLREIQEEMSSMRDRLSILESTVSNISSQPPPPPLAPRGNPSESMEASRIVYLLRPSGMELLYPGLERSLTIRVNELLPPSHRVTVIPVSTSSRVMTVQPVMPAPRPPPSLSSSDSPRRSKSLIYPRVHTLPGPLPPLPLPASPLTSSQDSGSSGTQADRSVITRERSSSVDKGGVPVDQKRIVLILRLLLIPDVPPNAADVAELIRVGERENCPGLILVARANTSLDLTNAIRDSAFGLRVLHLVILQGRGLVPTAPLSREGLRALATWLLAH